MNALQEDKVSTFFQSIYNQFSLFIYSIPVDSFIHVEQSVTYLTLSVPSWIIHGYPKMA